ncbi:MAG: MaoC/PaaZ C-terminal domain-containing protein [Parvibaculales bacterium]
MSESKLVLPGRVYYDDLEIGKVHDCGLWELDPEEMKAFARQWDPQPFHTDEAAARDSIYGGLTAASMHILSLMSIAVFKGPSQPVIIGALGAEYKIPNPMRAGEKVSITHCCTSKRLSKSRENAAIVVNNNVMSNQQGEIVLDFTCTVMIQAYP